MRSDLCSHVRARMEELSWMKALEGDQALGYSSLNGPNWVPNTGTGSSELNIESLRKEEYRLLVRKNLLRV